MRSAGYPLSRMHAPSDPNALTVSEATGRDGGAHDTTGVIVFLGSQSIPIWTLPPHRLSSLTQLPVRAPARSVLGE
jgi:hypothetical protein